MQYAETILDLVGGTPLVRKPPDARPRRRPNGSLLLAKLEMLKTRGSGQGSNGLPMIEASGRTRGLLKAGLHESSSRRLATPATGWRSG